MNLIYHFIATILSNSCPVPTGIFGPSLAMGALLGRIYGHLLVVWFDEDPNIVRGLAFVGAAAVSSCITRSTSVAIIVLELSG